MPVQPTYPGVYIVEDPSPVRTIMGVSTGTTAFIGPALQGPMNNFQMVTSWPDYVSQFGGITHDSQMSAAVNLYFLNGGQLALVVRVGSAAATAAVNLPDGTGANAVTLTATSPGSWANSLRVRVDSTNVRPLSVSETTASVQLWNLTVHDTSTGAVERYTNISTDRTSPQSATSQLANSRLLQVTAVGPTPPSDHKAPAAGGGVWDTTAANAASTGVTTPGSAGAPQISDYIPAASTGQGLYALDKADIVNILCLPDVCAGIFDVDSAKNINLKTDALDVCLVYCQKRRAMLILDPFPEWSSVDQARTRAMQSPLVTGSVEDAAVYFPWLAVADLVSGVLVPRPPSGAVAGVWARTDVNRGVWKAPAGMDDGVLVGVQDLTVGLIDATIGELNPLGVNCLRRLPLRGPVVWGARTIAGADDSRSQWKYVPVRRLALFVEESLYRGTQWVVFEPNDEPLWSQIRLNIGAFMDGLFRQGAFAGSNRRDAYLVKCDAENNPQIDIDHGIVNIVVGFAPLKPAEFVLLHIQQLSPLTHT